MVLGPPWWMMPGFWGTTTGGEGVLPLLHNGRWIVAATVLLACAGGDTKTRAEPSAMTAGVEEGRAVDVGTHAEATGAVGQLVRVRGTLRREKLGDSIHRPGLSILCLDHRFADPTVGAEIRVEGVLEIFELPQATVGPNGEIRQGVEGASSAFVLRGCRHHQAVSGRSR